MVTFQGFLHNWCQNRQFGKPTFNCTAMQNNSNGISSSKCLFYSEVKLSLPEIELTGQGQGYKVATAKSNAARDLCERLVMIGHMKEMELKTRIPGSIVKIKVKLKKKKSKLRQQEKSKSNEQASDKAGKEVKFSSDDDVGASNGSKIEPKNNNEKNKRKRKNREEDISTSSKRIKTEEGSQEDHHHSPTAVGITPEEEEKYMNELNNDIWTHYKEAKQSLSICQWKISIVDYLTTHLNPIFSSFQLIPVGSSVSGLGMYNCDMDLCLVVYDGNDEKIDRDRIFAKRVLRKVQKVLRRDQNVKRAQFINAKVPIVRLFYKDAQSKMEVDINCNELAGIRNTHLLHYYTSIDERFPALALLIKHWASMRGINDAATGTLSSYSLNLMLIHYLQYGVLQTYSFAKPILPNLQEIFPNTFHPNSNIQHLKLFEKLELPEQVPSSATRELSLADLLLGFFNYYTNYFDFTQMVPSVRTAGIIKKQQMCHRRSGELIYVEEPLERKNVAHAVNSKTKFQEIIEEFDLAYNRLRRSLSLDSIGVKLPKISKK